MGRLGTRAGLFLAVNDNLAKVGGWVHDGGACGGEGSGRSRGLVEPSQGVRLLARGLVDREVLWSLRKGCVSWRGVW